MAKGYSLPKDNILRAIDRGTGEGADADAIERILYEGYGPGGAAMLVEALSDNRNRTGSEIRHAFDRHGGNLGEPNSVAWMFEKRGLIIVDAGDHGEDDLIIAIDAGAEDVIADEDELRVMTAPGDLTAVREALEAEGITISGAEVTMEPSTTVEVEESDARRLIQLMEALDDHDDVDAVHANFDIPAEVLERVAV
jgi:YebC/PmpR family DNA-binding regulatory protein